MIAHLYMRFSHSDQAGGTSIARQRKLTRKLCFDNGWEIESEWIDEAKSASKGKNRSKGGALHEFEAEALAGLHHGSVLVCEKLDRISRQGYDATRDFISALGHVGVSVATEDGAFYEAGKTLTLIDVMTMLIKAETAREEAEKRADRTRERHAIQREAAQATGAAMGKLAPFWLSVKNGRYAAIPDRAALVLRIFEMADASDGALTIARKLNEEGVPVWQRWDKRPVRAWDRTRIRKILADEAVVGWRRAKDEPILLYPRIVPAELFERVRANAAVRSQTKGGGRSAVVANLVSGLATCEVCGGPMMYYRNRAEGAPYRTKPAGNIAYLKHESASLICRSAYHKRCRNRLGITYYGFERALLDAALHIALDDRAFVRSDDLGRISQQLAEKEQACRMNGERAERLWDAWSRDESSDMRLKLAERAEADAKALKAEVVTLREARAKAAGQVSAEEHLGRIAEVRKHLYDPDLEVRKVHRKKAMEGLRSVITHIWCDEDRTATIAFAGGLAALQIKGGKVIRKANAVAMFANGNFASLGVPDRTARAVYERITQTLLGKVASVAT